MYEEDSKSNLGLIISLIIGVLAIGGGLFALQKNESAKLSAQIKEMHHIVMDQQQKLDQLDTETVSLASKLTETEEENQATSDKSLVHWQTYVNSEDGYTLSYPANFVYKGSGISNYILNEQRFDVIHDPAILGIGIRKYPLAPDYASFDEYAEKAKTAPDQYQKPAVDFTFGDHIVLSQYTENGPGGAFMTYTAYEKGSDVMYHISISEPGFTNHKELAEQIISTFRIL